MKRISIIGGSGSGKSTLARKLSQTTGLPVVHLDSIHHGPNWTAVNRDITGPLVQAETAKDSWIIEGGYSYTRQWRMARADTLVFLDVPTWKRITRVVLRTIKGYGKSRAELPEGCVERFNLEFYLFVLNYEKRGARASALELLEEYKNTINCHHLTSNADIEAFLKTTNR